MRPIVLLFISLVLISFSAFADPKSEKAKRDQEVIQKKMFNPPPVLDSSFKPRVGVEATCTDARSIIRNSTDSLYKDCLEQRPQVAKPPQESTSPGTTTFGVRISR